MSVVVKEGSKVVVGEARKSVPAAESASRHASITGLIADIEVKHETRFKGLDEAKQKWLEAEEQRRLEREAQIRRRQRAVYD